MLELENLEVGYNQKKVLCGINLKLESGKSLCIIGESGAGKTTLGLSIIGLVKGAVTGKILLDGKNLAALPEQELRMIRWNKVSLVFQDVEGALNPLYTALDQVSEPIIAHKLKRKDEARRHALQLLKAVGLPEERSSAYPHQMSGGEKQRVLIAMAIANNPDLIILDEPTAALDAITKAEIINLIRDACKGRTILLLTHDLSTPPKLSDRIAVLYAGRILELGSTTNILSNPRHPYTRGLLRCYPSMTRTKDLQGIKGRMSFSERGCPFYPRCTQSIEICREVVPRLEEKGDRLIACHRGGIIPLMEVKKLSKFFSSSKAVDSVDLTLYEGETLGLVGETGSGKTTLAKTIMGIFEATEGEISLEGSRILNRDLSFYRRVQMVFQNPRESLSHRLSVLEAVKEPLEIQKLGNEEQRESKVRHILEEVELPCTEYLNKYPHQLSGGEAQRVAIARALILDPKLLIADEPTSALDASIQAKIVKLLLNLQEKRGISILFITHNLPLARKISDRIAVMLAGKIVEMGNTNEILGSESHPYTNELISPVSEDQGILNRVATIKNRGNCPSGCVFYQSCLFATEICKNKEPEMVELGNGHFVACHFI